LDVFGNAPFEALGVNAQELARLKSDTDQAR
jgi:hypothetical protein